MIATAATICVKCTSYEPNLFPSPTTSSPLMHACKEPRRNIVWNSMKRPSDVWGNFTPNFLENWEYACLHYQRLISSGRVNHPVTWKEFGAAHLPQSLKTFYNSTVSVSRQQVFTDHKLLFGLKIVTTFQFSLGVSWIETGGSLWCFTSQQSIFGRERTKKKNEFYEFIIGTSSRVLNRMRIIAFIISTRIY